MGCSNKIIVCTRGKSCKKKDSPKVFKRLKKLIEESELENVFKVSSSDCFGLCKHGPVVRLKPDGLSYGGVNKDDCGEILSRHAKRRKPIKRLLLKKAR
ncbi:MAG: (2Fe-2S) ferredoxin domain-containing protein [Cyanobacteria bacterium HKST-UBA02]|nr:(2Fe-2S) ferredoxin domain-containing protein [Cyanobacteria bacterium HKST-UBA02]